MFVQLIEGKVNSPQGAREAFDRWVADLAEGADGWLGSTAGVTEDGRFIAVARFESTDKARANSSRAEQGEWWAETAKLFDGEARFRDSTEIDVDLPGDPDSAGFVQVVQGRTSDPARARELMGQDSDKWAEFRPEVLGSLGVDHGDGTYTAVLYFTTEAEAREGERKEAPPELKEQMDEMAALEIGEPSFLDLKTPWLYTP